MAATRRDDTVLLLAVGIALSLLLHAVAYVALAAVDRMSRAWQPPGSQVEVVIEEPEAEVERPEPPPEPEPEAPQAPTPRDPPEPRPEPPEPTPPAAAEEPQEPEQEPSPAEETPVPFPGKMLSNNDGDWNVAPGSGEDRQGPLPAPARETGREREGRSDGTPDGRGEAPATGARVVPLADLSGPPGPPSNTAKYLEELYPARAKQQGVEAVAKVRVRINADGSLGPMRVESESLSGYGFADACRRALRRAGDWSPPRGPSGRPVATWITYRCNFEVR